jgi:hypothetical protein
MSDINVFLYLLISKKISNNIIKIFILGYYLVNIYYLLVDILLIYHSIIRGYLSAGIYILLSILFMGIT